MTTETNYFVCTLGEAASGAHSRPYRNVNHLLNQQAQNNPELLAVGFCKVGKSRTNECFDYETLTFRQVYHGVHVVAGQIKKTINIQPGQTVGLLSSSSPEFLFTWLACIQLRLTVFLIAPECSPSGIAHLCRSSGVKHLFADVKNTKLGNEAILDGSNESHSSFQCIPMPVDGDTVFDTTRSTPGPALAEPEIQGSDIAYLHHTSGTSSGLPKPIPQTHNGAVGVLPALNGAAYATFTTTPLYHGGPADIFRAWTSNAMIWLYPSKDIPVTASNIVRCLETTRQAAESQKCSPVSYFATVPYILSMLLHDESALQWLRQMAAVSVGGAALPKDIGDAMVNHDVNLVSRFGSAECGFLMSSHRAYSKDKAWQYLRHPQNSTEIKFEAQESGLSELIVLSNWPHLAKRNREDGSYASADLFEPHPDLENAWRYHSRADSQLTLVTGKKFDPAPIEDAVVAASSVISDALIFGDGQAYPGILLFRSKEASEHDDQEIIRAVAPVLEKIGRDSQAHTRLNRDMLVPMPYTLDAIEKSSKGTVLRGRATERYASAIEGAYNKRDTGEWRDCPDDKIKAAIRDIISNSVSHPSDDLTDSADLFSYGVDSVAGIKIRHNLQQLLRADQTPLPATIVEDCGSIESLTTSMLRLRHGESLTDVEPAKDDTQQMLDLVERYSHFPEPQTAPSTNGVNGPQHRKHVVLLTGATGSLGAHVLGILRTIPDIKKIYCLVRGADQVAAHERVNKALLQRHLPALHSSDQVEVVRATLSHEQLGLADDHYNSLSREITLVMHLAWSVNFRMKLSSFEKDNIAGVRNLLQFALASSHAACLRFVFCSSVASAMAYPGAKVPEQLLEDPSVATNIGYSQSKWVAEHICQRASDQTRLRGKISVFRVGQLSGDTRYGVWNAKEAWPLMLGSVRLTKTLPRLDDELLDWLPVDVAAAAMVQGALLEAPAGGGDQCMPIYHVLNDNTGPSWTDLLRWMHKQLKFEEVSPSAWIDKLDDKTKQGSHHPALQLLEHWRAAYAVSKPAADRKQFNMERTKVALPALQNVKPVDEEYFETLWRWIDAAVD